MDDRDLIPMETLSVLDPPSMTESQIRNRRVEEFQPIYLPIERSRVRPSYNLFVRLYRYFAARIEAKRVETERLAKIEADRIEAERVEAERIKHVKAECIKRAKRIARIEAARVEAERIAMIEAARIEAARVEAERIAMIEAAKIKAARVEAERIEATRIIQENIARVNAEHAEAERIKRAEAERILRIKFPETCVKTDNTTKWYINGKLGRYDGKPSVTIIDENKTVHMWHCNGELHCVNNPAYIEIHGDITETKWCINGKLHRINLPAYLSTCKNGYLSEEKWYCNGKLHRNGDLPAVILTHIRGRTTYRWYCNGELHRSKGYAVEGYDKEKWIHGKMKNKLFIYEKQVWENSDKILGAKPSARNHYYKYWPNGNKKTFTNTYLENINGYVCQFSDITTWWKNGCIKSHDTKSNVVLKTINSNNHTIFFNPTKFVYDLDGNIHCDDGPAFIKHFIGYTVHKYNTINLVVRFNNIIEACYLIHGKFHRDVLPACIIKIEQNLYTYVWCTNGKIHRNGVDVPAVVYEFSCKKLNLDKYVRGSGVMYEQWYINGEPGRLNGYAVELGNNFDAVLTITNTVKTNTLGCQPVIEM